MSYFNSLISLSNIYDYGLSNVILNEFWNAYKNDTLDTMLKRILNRYSEYQSNANFQVLSFIKDSLKSKKIFQKIDNSKQLTLISNSNYRYN